MSTMTPDPVLPEPLETSRAHPDWCDPAVCRPDGHAVTHLSRPVAWRMQGEDVEVTMRRQQTEPDGEPLIAVTLVNDAFPDEPTTLLLTRADRERMILGFHELRGWR